MDCFAVAIGEGFSNRNLKSSRFFIVSLIFGIAHFFMPLFGWLIGDAFKVYIESFDHWIAFLLLVGIGAKMLIESFKKDIKSISIEKTSVVIMLAVATSIDALIIGMSLAFLNFNLLVSAAVISFFAFFISFLGFNIGKKFGGYYGNKAEIIGGVILIAIGIKILIEHLLNKV